MDGTIRDNICYGLGTVDKEKIHEAVEMAYAAEFINDFLPADKTQILYVIKTST